MCVSDDRYSDKISSHRFPKDETLKKEWTVKIRRDEGPLFKITASTVVCSLHFKDEDLKWTPVKKMLKEGAVPPVFNWTEDKRPRRVLQRKQLKPRRDEEDETTLTRETVCTACDGVSDQQTEPMETEENTENLQEMLRLKSAVCENLKKQPEIECFDFVILCALQIS